MPASFPTSVKSFGADHVNGDVLVPGDVNDLRAEVVAIETALGAGMSTVWAAPFGSKNLRGTNNAASPNTKYDFSADYVVLVNAAGSPVLRSNTGTLTCDTALAGPAANGHDGAGAFAASTWLHFYMIWNGTTLATLVSTVTPLNGPPVLPGGYTHWCYLTAIYYDASSHLSNTVVRGNKVTYLGTARPVAAGSATAETAVSLTAYIPPNCLSYGLYCSLSFTNTSTSAITFNLRLLTGVAWEGLSIQVQVANIVIWTYAVIDTPNISQNIFYFWGAAAGTRAAYLDILYYIVPNGG